jgi:hypothetical protein
MGFTLTREQLYELVWSQPMHKLGKQIGISDVAIAKRCRKLGIPVPRRGYWNRLHARKKVSKAALHPRDLGTINEAEFSGTLTDELRALITGQPGVAAVQDDDIETLAARFRKRLGKVAAPRDFSSTHPAVAKLLQEDEAIRQEAAKRSYYWKEPQFDTPLETRRLRIINALFLAAASVGGGGSVRGERAAELHLNIGALHIGFGLEPREQARSRGITPGRGGNGKNGNALRITLTRRNLPAGVATRWEDSKGAPLERQLTSILVGMAVAGEHSRRK